MSKSRTDHLARQYPPTPQEAAERGLAFYYTGKPCKHGHLAPRRIDTCACSQCLVDAKVTRRNKLKAALQLARELATTHA